MTKNIYLILSQRNLRYVQSSLYTENFAFINCGLFKIMLLLLFQVLLS
jgi:hypothetical protein